MGLGRRRGERRKTVILCAVRNPSYLLFYIKEFLINIPTMDIAREESSDQTTRASVRQSRKKSDIFDKHMKSYD